MTHVCPFAVHVVDDEEALRDSLGFLFASRRIASRLWPSGKSFLAAWPQPDCGCIILDVRMEGLLSPQVLDRLLQNEGGFPSLPPIIFLTGHADVPLAVQSPKSGAFDFLEKPFNDNQIVDLALRVIQMHQNRTHESDSRLAIEARFATLSAREAEVMTLIPEGQLNKQIADRLNIAIRTVAVLRSRVLQKVGARNSVELAQMRARLV